MRGTVLHAPGDIRLEQRPDPTIVEPTDAIIRLSATCICGSDLWPYRGIELVEGVRPMGHEYVGTVEEVGRDVTTIKPGQFVATVKELTNGLGAHSVIEAVGTRESMLQAIGACRPGGHVGFVGVTHGDLPGSDLFFSHVHLHGGPAPVRRFLPELMELISNGTIEPGRVFDRTLPLDDVAEGYRAMDERRSRRCSRSEAGASR